MNKKKGKKIKAWQVSRRDGKEYVGIPLTVTRSTSKATWVYLKDLF